MARADAAARDRSMAQSVAKRRAPRSSATASVSPAAPSADVPAAVSAAEIAHADLFAQPGHLIRRAQQIAVSMFLDAVGGEVTPVQYAVLRRLLDRPGIDQVTLAREIALDTSTTADTAARLEAKGWIVRELRARRQRSLALTDAGRAQLTRLMPAIHRMNAQMLGVLPEAERESLMRVLRSFVELNNAHSRAPHGGGDPDDRGVAGRRRGGTSG
jgi:DNA-binding MarR family transcriptional regulator